MARSPFLLLCSLLLLISVVSAIKQRLNGSGGQRGRFGDQNGRQDDQRGDSTDHRGNFDDRRDGSSNQRSDTNRQGSSNDQRNDGRGNSNDRRDSNYQRNSDDRRNPNERRGDSDQRTSNDRRSHSEDRRDGSNEHRSRPDSRRHRPMQQNGSPCTMGRSGMHLRATGSNNYACKQSCKVKGCTRGVCQGQKRAECQCQNCTVVPPTEPPPMATCVVTGDPHIWPFVGWPFTPVTAPGYEHLLLRPKRSSGRGNKWSVSFLPFSCNNQAELGNHLTTCLEATVVRVGRLVIELSRYNYLQVNKRNKTVPWYYPNSDSPTVTVEAYQAGMKLTTSDHLTIVQEIGPGLAPQATMTVPKAEYDGYCNVTGDTTPSDTVPDLCIRSLEQVTKECAPISDPNGPFEACISQLQNTYFSKTAYFFNRNCVYDVCSVPTATACGVMKDFVDICMARIPELVIDWRSAELCPPSCPTGMVYTQCASTCPNTCADPNGSELCKAAECKGGCVCKSGSLLENGKCIPSSRCGCSDKMGYHTAGETWADISCTQKCRCKGRNAVCSRDQNAKPCPLPL